MSKALGLLSGGLDSSLAALALKRQGVDVTGIAFVTPFFGSSKAEEAAAQMEIPLIVRDISEVHLAMLKNPRYGYGKNMNPCIDCHAMMFRLAGEVMKGEGFDFLFSGEVLGQRPMSQNLTALKTVSKHSGVGDRILRPLSAKLLPITPMEEEGLVDREGLLDIQGRSRKRQEALAAEWGLKEYPSSGGGCLLTEKHFSDRLRDLFTHHPEADVVEVELLKVGRQFRISPEAKLTLGRNKEDNEKIKALARSGDLILKADDLPGPIGLFSGTPKEDDIRTACAIVASYGKGQKRESVAVRIAGEAGEEVMTIPPLPREVSLKLIL